MRRPRRGRRPAGRAGARGGPARTRPRTGGPRTRPRAPAPGRRPGARGPASGRRARRTRRPAPPRDAGRDWWLAQAPIRDPQGRLAKYAAVSAARHPLGACRGRPPAGAARTREHERDGRVGRELAALARGVVGEEHEAALVGPLEQDVRAVGAPSASDGRERHRVRLRRCPPASASVVPAPELGQRSGRERVLVEAVPARTTPAGRCNTEANRPITSRDRSVRRRRPARVGHVTSVAPRVCRWLLVRGENPAKMTLRRRGA